MKKVVEFAFAGKDGKVLARAPYHTLRDESREYSDNDGKAQADMQAFSSVYGEGCVMMMAMSVTDGREDEEIEAALARDTMRQQRECGQGCAQ